MSGIPCDTPRSRQNFGNRLVYKRLTLFPSQTRSRPPTKIRPRNQLGWSSRRIEGSAKENGSGRSATISVEKKCDFFEFKLNTPKASHAEGVWERMIRTVRNALDGLLEQHGTQLDEESLRTLICEAEAIVNSRPIVAVGTNSPEVEPLTPNHLLTMKSRVLMAPPGEFQRADVYLVKRWKRVQYLANQFWERWRKGFLWSLQERQKWNRPRRNVQKGDIVLLKDDPASRNQWRTARVEKVCTDEDGLVRKVTVVVGDPSLNEKGERIRSEAVLERPVQKLIVLLKAEDNDSPSRSQIQDSKL